MTTTIAQTAAWVATIGFIGIMCFQTLLALGFPLGQVAWGRKYEKLPLITPIAVTLSLTCLIVAVASCSNAPTSTPTQEPLLRQIDEAEKQWQEQEIESYRIEVLTVRGTWHAQYHEITVRNGHVVDESASCTPAPAELGECEVEPFNAQDFTVPALFAQARTQAQIGPEEQIRITYDPGYGFPSLISRSQPEITDGGVVWRVEAFEALE